MKTYYSVLIGLLLATSLGSCQPQNAQQNFREFSAAEFEKEIAKNNSVQLIDVRTREEFEQEHLAGAVNFDIHAADFEKKINRLDKNKPVLIYCLSGGRSATAAAILVQKGFSEVHNMTGGLMQWPAGGKQLISGKTEVQEPNMTIEAFKEELRTDKFVLVDYNAKWCEPCKRMAPMLAGLATRKKEQLILLAIDADENKIFMREKGINSLPVLELYKNGKLIWKHEGEISEQDLLEQTKL